jgi:Flp pilus assembly protein TadD
MQVLTGDFTGAEKSYEAALLRSPDNRKVMNNIAMLIADHGYDLPRAQRLAEQLIRDDPDNPVFADTLGWVCLRQGRGKEAVPLLKMAAVGLPRSPTVRYHLGAALLATGDHVSGRRELAQALSLSRDFTGAAQARTLLASSPAKSR